MQEDVGGRVLGSGCVRKKVWMQFISPWRRGEMDSLFVAIVWGVRVERERIAAPKSLEPVVIRV